MNPNLADLKMQPFTVQVIREHPQWSEIYTPGGYCLAPARWVEIDSQQGYNLAAYSEFSQDYFGSYSKDFDMEYCLSVIGAPEFLKTPAALLMSSWFTMGSCGTHVTAVVTQACSEEYGGLLLVKESGSDPGSTWDPSMIIMPLYRKSPLVLLNLTLACMFQEWSWSNVLADRPTSPEVVAALLEWF